MNKRARAYVLVAVVLMAAAGSIRYGYTEMSALAWHAQHGFHAERGGIRFRIPLSFEEADVSSGLPTLTLTKRWGRIWAGGGVISVFFGKHPSLEARQAREAMAEAMLAKRGLGVKRKSVGERTAVLAGRSGKCIESTPVVDQARLQQLFEKRDMRDIECSFGDDVEVEFIGTGNLKDDFYNIIQTAEPVQRKL